MPVALARRALTATNFISMKNSPIALVLPADLKNGLQAGEDVNASNRIQLTAAALNGRLRAPKATALTTVPATIAIR